LTEEGELRVFRWFLLRAYEELIRHTGSKWVEIPIIRAKVLQELKMNRKKFDELLLRLEKFDNKLSLSPARVFSADIRRESIETDRGFLYYLYYGEG